MAQEIINTGAAANDGTGDPLRTAFIKTDNNFDQIWAAGPVGTNVRISGNTITTLTVNTDLALSPNGAANVRLNNNTIPGANNTWYLGSATNRWRGAYIGSAGLSVDGNVTITGNLSAGNIQYTSNVFVGDLQGSVFADDSTLIVDSINNAIYADEGYLGTVTATGNVSGNYFIGNGALLTGIASTYGNANVAAYLPTYTGDITANNITVSRTIRVGTLPSGNLEIVDDTPGNGPAIKTPGGSGLDLLIEPSGNLLLSPDGGEVIVEKQTASTNFNTGALLVYGGIGADGNINISGNVSAAGWTGNLIPSANAVYSLGNATNYWSNLWVANNTIYIGGVPLGISAGNVLTVNGEAVLSNDSDSTITTTGNITANYFIGDGSQLTGLPDGTAITNGTSTIDIPTANGNIVVGVNNVGSTEFTELGITTLNLAALANITATGNITANYFLGNGSLLTGIASTGNITFTDTTMSPPDGEDIIISAANSQVDIQSLDFRVVTTDDVRITGNDVVSLRNLSTTEPISIIADYDNTQKSWEFGADGTLTAPGDITTAGDVTGTSGAGTLVLRAQPASNTLVQLNNSVDSGISTVANLEIRTDVDGTTKQWLFDTNGDLTVPNYVNFAGATYIGDETGGASPLFRIATPLTSSVTIETDSDIAGNNWTWNFGADGVLTFPGNVDFGGDASAAPSLNDFFSVTSAVGFDIVANSAGTSKTFEFGADGDFTVPGNVSATRLQNDGNLVIRSNVAGTAKTWTFDTLGDLSLPVGGNISGSGLITAATASITGNVTAANFIGNVSLTGNITGTSANVELVAGSYTWTFDNTGNTAFANGTVSANDVTLTGNISATVNGYSIGYREIPQVVLNANTTAALADSGKHFYSTTAGDLSILIPTNANVAFPTGTAFTVVVQAAGNVLVNADAGVTLYMAGSNSAGNRTVGTYGMATVMKVATDTWFINGTGVY